MFFHNFKYTFKVLLKNKSLVFWSILWPLILGTLFYMAFSNISNAEKLDTIALGIVKSEAYDENLYLSSTLKELSNPESDAYLFDITYGTEEELEELLEDKKISAYLIVDSKVKAIVKENGIHQTVVKSVIDEIGQYQILIENIMLNASSNNVDIIQFRNQLFEKIGQEKSYIKDISKSNMDYMMIEFYTLVAMACLYSCLLSTEAVKNYLANINKKGARVSLAPIRRLTLLLSGLFASFVIQMVSIAVLLLYTHFLLKVDYGSKTGLVILLSVVGSLAGLALGVVLGSISVKSDNTRTGIANIIVMFGCFLAGMMGVTMKYVVDTNLPIVNKLNPSNMITDGFYALYYYEDLSRFYFDLLSLLILFGIFMVIAYYLMRRKKYDSI